ncbi:hypothetical protein SEVIR_7G232501v4 [Setaria viridis]
MMMGLVSQGPKHRGPRRVPGPLSFSTYRGPRRFARNGPVRCSALPHKHAAPAEPQRGGARSPHDGTRRNENLGDERARARMVGCRCRSRPAVSHRDESARQNPALRHICLHFKNNIAAVPPPQCHVERRVRARLFG